MFLHVISYKAASLLGYCHVRVPSMHMAPCISLAVGFTFDEVQVVSLEDDSKDMAPMLFDQYNSTLVLSMMSGMSYLAGLGLGCC